MNNKSVSEVVIATHNIWNTFTYFYYKNIVVRRCQWPVLVRKEQMKLNKGHVLLIVALS